MLGIYTRLSKEDESSNSIDNQIREAMEFEKTSKTNGYKLYNEGEGISGGAKIKDRPKLSELIQDIENGVITSVWFRDQNRLERSGLTFYSFVEVVRDNDVQVYIANKLQDYNDADSFLTTGILSVLNENKILKQSQQTKKALHDNLKEGKTRGGILPYGYTKDANKYILIDKDESKVIKRIYSLSLEGVGTNQIAQILNDEGVPTRYNKMKEGTITTINKYTKKKTTTDKKDVKWAGNTIRNILKNEVYKGVKYLGKGKERKQYPYPIIIEALKWQQVQENLPNNRNNSGKKVEYRYLLKGLIRCGKCGRNYYGKSRQPRKGQAYRPQHTYKCSSHRKGFETCGNLGINITKIESFVIKHLFQSKDLYNILLDEITNDDTVDQLEIRASTLRDDLKALKVKENRIYSLLLDSDLKDDNRLKNDYTTTKGKVTNTKNLLDEVCLKIEQEKNTDKVNDLDTIFQGFTLENNFKVIKEQVHQLIENIEINFSLQTDEKVKGVYFINISYSGFKTLSLYITDHNQNTWNLFREHKSEAITPQDLEDDRQLTIELTGNDPMSEEMVEKYGEFKGMESTNSGFFDDAIQLTKEDLIDFN
jgi:site-specific DNA recombinase